MPRRARMSRMAFKTRHAANPGLYEASAPDRRPKRRSCYQREYTPCTHPPRLPSKRRSSARYHKTVAALPNMMNESQDGHEALLATGADDGAPMTDIKSGSTPDEKPEMQVAGTRKADKNAQNTADSPNVLKINGLRGEKREAARRNENRHGGIRTYRGNPRKYGGSERGRRRIRRTSCSAGPAGC